MDQKVRGNNHTVTASFTRPNDAILYTAGDVVADSTTVATILKLKNASREDGNPNASGGGQMGPGIIQGACLTISANQATKPEVELWIFDTAPAVVQDNAAFAPSNAEMLTLVGVIPFPASSFKVGKAGAGAAGNIVCDVNNLGLAFNAVSGHTLYGVFVVRNGYTPVAQEVWQVRAKVLD